MAEKEKKPKLFQCIICPNKSQYGMFKFPKSPVIRQKWLDICQRSAVHDHEKICFQHFQPACFSSKRLNESGTYKLWNDAVPTLNLPMTVQTSNDSSSVSIDHDYCAPPLSNEDKIKVKAASKKYLCRIKVLKKQLTISNKTIGRLCKQLKDMQKKMDSKEFKEKTCMDILKDKLSQGQLDILVKVSLNIYAEMSQLSLSELSKLSKLSLA